MNHSKNGGGGSLSHVHGQYEDGNGNKCGLLKCWCTKKGNGSQTWAKCWESLDGKRVDKLEVIMFLKRAGNN